MSRRIQITEYLDIDLDTENWVCNRCNFELGSAKKRYKEGCLVYDRNPRDIYNPIKGDPFSFAPDPKWIRYLEYYCPNCGVMIEVEVLPPGHPIVHDIEVDLKALKKRYEGKDDESHN
jgi:acetone carboxylase gamma subunit